MNVDTICTRSVRSCDSDATLAEIGTLMWTADCGAVPVIDAGGRLVGMITDRDVCVALSLTGRSATAVTARLLLQPVLHTCRLTDGVRDALRTMRTQKVRRLPVVDGAGVLQGILSISDLARAAKPERLAGPGDITDEDVSLAMKMIYAKPKDLPQVAPVPAPATVV